jgi:autotransporter-associated beta strand protein
MRGRQAIIAAACGSAVAMLASPRFVGAVITWDRGGVTELWNTASNWNPDVVPTSVDDVTFPATIPSGDPLITVPNGAQAKTLTFNSTYTLNLGDITLSGGAITVASGKTASWSFTNLAHGSAQWSKLGTGTLVLNGAGTGSGNSVISAGTLRISNSSALGTGEIDNQSAFEMSSSFISNNVLMYNGSILRATGGCAVSGVFSLFTNASATIAPGATSSDNFNFPLNPGSIVGGAGCTINIGDGTAVAGRAILQANSSFGGNWYVNGATLQLSNAAALGIGTSAVGVTAGTLELTNNVTLSRDVALHAGGNLRGIGTALMNNPVSVDSGAAVTLDGGTSSTDRLFLQGLTAINGGGAGSTIAVTGSGKVALNGTNTGTYAGTWNINAKLALFNEAGLGNASNTFNLNSGGVLEANQSATPTVTRVVTLNGGSLGAETGGTITLTAAPSGAAVALHSVGSGKVVLQAASARTAANFIDGGILRVEHADALGTGITHIAANCTLELGNLTFDHPVQIDGNVATILGTGSSAAYVGTLSVPSTNSIALSTGTSPTDVLTIGNATNDLTGGGGSTSITVKGSGRVVLAQPSDYTGAWQLSSTLRVSNTNQLGNSANQIFSNIGGVLEISGAAIDRSVSLLGTGGVRGIGSAGNNGSITVATGAQPILSTGTTASDVLTVGNAANDLTGGTSATVTVNGSGTVALPFANNYSGEWNVAAGTLRIASPSSLGTSSNPVSVSGGALEFTALTLARGVTLSNGGTLRGTGTSGFTGTATVANNAAVFLSTGFNGTDTLTFGDGTNDLTGGGGTSSITVPVNSIGRITLTQASDYVGSWLLNGKVRVSADNQLGNAANPVDIEGGALEIISSFTSSRAFTCNDGFFGMSPGATLTLNSGLGGGSGALTKTGGGLLVLKGPSARTGDTTIGFDLRVENATALGTAGTGMISLFSGALEIGGVTVNKPITLVSDAGLRGTGLARSNGTTAVSSGAHAFLSTGDSATDQLIVGDASNDLTGGGGGSSITVQGAGKVVLTRASNYVGNWTVSFSTLQLDGDDRLGDVANTITLDNGTLRNGATFTTGSRPITLNPFTDNTIDTAGFNVRYGNIDGAGNLIKNSTGQLTTDHVRCGLLTINNGRVTITVGPSADHTSRADGVNIANGILDLENNKLIDTGLFGDDLGTWNGAAYTGVTGMVARGYHGGDWLGNGIVTTQPNATGGNTLTSIGVAPNSALSLSTFGGLSVSASDILVMYTYAGDANLDGAITGDDYFQIDSAFPQGLSGWMNGDFNYDGAINGDDYFLIDSNFAAQGAAIPTSGGLASATPLTAVPEPSSLIVFCVCGLLMPRRARH